MRHSSSKRANKELKSIFVLAGVLLAAFGVIIGLEALKNQNQKHDLLKIGQIGKLVLLLFVCLVIIGINVGIGYLVEYLSKDERHLTKTNEILSRIIKTVISQFINTAIFIFLAAVIMESSFTTGSGLVLQMLSLVVLILIISLLLSLFPPAVIYKSFSYFCKYRNLK